MRAPYDEIADWYESEFLDGLKSGLPERDSLGLRRIIHDLLGPGHGPCLEIGCGTGIHADAVRKLGWSPFGIDISSAMLRHARTRVAAVQANAERLPIRDESLGATIAMMVHTDMPGYPAVLRDVARVLRPGGIFVHVGVHPCFCGGFADRSDPGAVIIRPGYLDARWTKASWSEEGVRHKVGATHWPLPELLHAFEDAGLELERFAEGGAPVPTVLAIRARKPA